MHEKVPTRAVRTKVGSLIRSHVALLFISDHQMHLMDSISPAISYLSLFSPLGCLQKQIDHTMPVKK